MRRMNDGRRRNNGGRVNDGGTTKDERRRNDEETTREEVTIKSEGTTGTKERQGRKIYEEQWNDGGRKKGRRTRVRRYEGMARDTITTGTIKRRRVLVMAYAPSNNY